MHISDQSKEVSQDWERRRKLHCCIQTAIDSPCRDSRSARRDSSLFFQTFHLGSSSLGRFRRINPRWKTWNPSKTTAPFFVPASPRERTIAPFLRRVLTLSAQFPRSRASSGQINLYRGKIAVICLFLPAWATGRLVLFCALLVAMESESSAKVCKFVCKESGKAFFWTSAETNALRLGQPFRIAANSTHRSLKRNLRSKRIPCALFQHGRIVQGQSVGDTRSAVFFVEGNGQTIRMDLKVADLSSRPGCETSFHQHWANNVEEETVTVFLLPKVFVPRDAKFVELDESWKLRTIFLYSFAANL